MITVHLGDGAHMVRKFQIGKVAGGHKWKRNEKRKRRSAEHNIPNEKKKRGKMDANLNSSETVGPSTLSLPSFHDDPYLILTPALSPNESIILQRNWHH